MRKDLALTLDGDIKIGPTGDLDLVRGDFSLRDQIIFRLKTQRGDWLLFPECGADLETVIGLQNSPDTGALIEDSARYALLHDGFLAESDIQLINAVPLSENEIVLFLTINGEEGNLEFQIPLDLREGKIEVLM
jgi:hypothetical protein